VPQSPNRCAVLIRTSTFWISRSAPQEFRCQRTAVWKTSRLCTWRNRTHRSKIRIPTAPSWCICDCTQPLRDVRGTGSAPTCSISDITRQGVHCGAAVATCHLSSMDLLTFWSICSIWKYSISRIMKRFKTTLAESAKTFSQPWQHFSVLWNWRERNSDKVRK